MKKYFFTALFSLSVVALISQPISSKAVLVETILSNGAGKLCIPYNKYVLPNGLTLIVSEDHSDPIVHTEIMYHVGSARETEGRSGFAHFFEHMMFQGSGHVADEQHFKLVTEAGGNMNGNTTRDRTTYFETLPSNNLELALWLESDRMGFLLDSVTQKKFEIQRSTVKNERGQNYDNAPYGLVREKIGQAMYPKGHPYSWSTIGYLADLDAADVTDLRNFFLRWYGPNNATLLIIGDVKTAEVVLLVEKYFGSFKRGPEVSPMPQMPATLAKDRCISYGDNIRFPQLTIVRPGVSSFTADEAPLDALCDIISNGKGSVFYKVFIESKVAQSASMYNPTSELDGEVTINIKTFPDHSPHEADSLVNVALSEFEKRGVSDDDLKRFKLSMESSQLNSLTTVAQKSSSLAVYQTFYGNANLIQKDLDRYQNITKEDVMRVYFKYIKNKPAVVLTVYPKANPKLKARPDDFTIPIYDAGSEESADYKSLVYNRPNDNLDRSKKPIQGATPIINVPNLWKSTYSNGLQLIGTQTLEIPQTYLMLTISAGHRQEDTAQAGIANLVVKMLDQSTKNNAAAAIEKKLELLGSEVSISAGETDINVFIRSFTRNLDSTLLLVNEKLFNPKWDPTEFDLMKKQQLEEIASMSTSARQMASFIYAQQVYGAANIMSFPQLGTASTISRLSLENVKSYWGKMFDPSIAKVTTVTDLPQSLFEPKLAAWKNNWKSVPVVLKADAPSDKNKTTEPTKIFLYNKPESAQSEIRIGRLGMQYDATGEFYKAGLMNYELGGNFNSHINLKLREEKGWTYGARSNFSGSNYTGTFTASAGVRWNATDSSVVEFVKAIKEYATNGIKPEELAYTKKAISQGEALDYENPFAKLGFLKNILEYKLPDNYIEQQNKVLMNITKEEIDMLAKKWLDADHMVISVVGDKTKIGAALSKLGYEVVEVDALGMVVPLVELKPAVRTNQVVTEVPKVKKKKAKRKTRGAKYDKITD